MHTGCKMHPVHTRPLRVTCALPRHQTDRVLLGVEGLTGSFLLAQTDDGAEPRLSQPDAFAKRSRRQKQKWKAQLIRTHAASTGSNTHAVTAAAGGCVRAEGAWWRRAPRHSRQVSSRAGMSHGHVFSSSLHVSLTTWTECTRHG
jgi:hypothetical protein